MAVSLWWKPNMPTRDQKAEGFAIRREFGRVAPAQNTMYGGKKIPGDTVFVFASENECGPGLVARRGVTRAEAICEEAGRRTADTACYPRHQTHRTREAGPLGRIQPKPFTDWIRPPDPSSISLRSSGTNKITASSRTAGVSSAEFF